MDDRIVTPKHGRGKIRRSKKGDPMPPGGGRPRKIPSLEKLIDLQFGVTDESEIPKSELAKILANLTKIAKNPKTPVSAVQAAERLLDRVYGKSKSNDTVTVRTQTEKEMAESDAAAAAVIAKFHGAKTEVTQK